MNQLRVLLVDDQVLFREAIANLISSREDMMVVGEAGDGVEAIEKARILKPDIILMDIRMPRMDGLEATRRIRAEMPESNIVILTVSDDDDDLFEAIKSGAIGYLLKSLKAESLFERLKGVVKGEAALSPLLATRVLEEFSRLKRRRGTQEEGEAALTEREREVIQYVIGGKSNKEIAATLGIAESTVKRHLHNILEKLHLQNRAQAAAYAVRKGLVDELPGEKSPS